MVFSSTKAVVLWNITAQILGKVVTGAVTFIFSLYIARWYGALGFGDFTKITTYVAIFYLFSDFGFNATFLRKQYPHEISWNTLLGLRLIGGVFLTFVAVSILAFLPMGTSQGYTSLVRFGIILFAPSIIFQSIITTSNAIFQKHLRYDFSTFAVVVGSFVSLVLLWIGTRLFNLHVGALISVTSLLIGGIISALISLAFGRRFVTTLRPEFNIANIQTLFFASLPLGLTLLCNVVYFHVDNIVLSLSRSTVEVGLYGFAYKFFELLLVFPTFFMNALYPLLLKFNREYGKSLVIKSSVILLASGVMATLATWYLSPLLQLIRPEFASSAISLNILAIGFPGFFLSSLSMWYLVAKGKQLMLLSIYAISMVLTTVADIVFIPAGGYIAASWITVLSEYAVVIVAMFLVYQCMRKEREV